MLWTWLFWKDAIERAIRDACGAMIAVITVNNTPGVPGHIDDPAALAMVAGVASFVSILTSIVASGVTKSPNASIVEVKGDIPPDKGKKS